MRVYHYLPAQHALSNLVFQRIKIARFSDLNDPFELLGTNRRQAKKHDAAIRCKDDIDKEKGVICFSRANHDPVLWAHYADRHRGVCLGFEVPDDFVKQVQYIKKPMKITKAGDLVATKDGKEFDGDILTAKYENWAYENEWRAIVDLGKAACESDLYFYPFSKSLVLREVFLGACCDLPIKKIREVVSSFGHEVFVVKCKLGVTKFATVEDRKETRSTKTKTGVSK